MGRYTYDAYYDCVPTVTDPLRSALSDDEIRERLVELPVRLHVHCGGSAHIDAGKIEAREVRGVRRLTRRVTIEVPSDDRVAREQMVDAFNDLHLFGDPVPQFES